MSRAFFPDADRACVWLLAISPDVSLREAVVVLRARGAVFFRTSVSLLKLSEPMDECEARSGSPDCEPWFYLRLGPEDRP